MANRTMTGSSKVASYNIKTDTAEAIESARARLEEPLREQGTPVGEHSPKSTKRSPQLLSSINTQSILTKYTNISIRRLATEFNLNYQMMLKIQRKPIPGTIYDPTAINYELIDEYISTRVTQAVIDDKDWKEINEDSVPTTRENLAKQFQEYKIGELYTIRGHEQVWEVIYITEDHIALKEQEGSRMKCMNANTFIHQTPRQSAKEDK